MITREEMQQYKLALQHTDPTSIFSPLNEAEIKNILGKPYFIYNSCGPLNNTDLTHTQAFQERNKDCLYISIIVPLTENETAESLPLPETIKKLQDKWREEDRTDIPTHREEITLKNQKYVQFSIMADYAKVANAHQLKLVKEYKNALKSDKRIYDTLPSSGENKHVSLHMLRLDTENPTLPDFDKGGKSIVFYNDETKADFVTQCTTLDAGCNPQKRFAAQLASIAYQNSLNQNSNFLIEKKDGGHSHYAIHFKDSDKTVWIDGRAFENDKLDNHSLWQEQGYYRFLEFLKVPVLSDEQFVNTSYKIYLGMQDLDASTPLFEVSAYDEEKKGNYTGLFKNAPDPHPVISDDYDLFGHGFRTGLMISLPFDSLLVEMARYTKHNIDAEINRLELENKNSEEIELLSKLLKEFSGEKVNYTENELVMRAKKVDFAEIINMSPIKIGDEDSLKILNSMLFDLQNTSAESDLSKLKEKSLELNVAIEQMQHNKKNHSSFISVQGQFLNSIRHEAKRQLAFLEKHMNSIIFEAKEDAPIIEGIKKKLDASNELKLDKNEESVLHKRRIAIPKKMSGADEQRLFHEKIDMLMECLPLKEEYLNARMRMLGDITNYSVDNENDLATSSTKDEVENDSTASSTRHALLNDTTDSNKRDRLEYNPTISHAKNGFFNHPPQEKTVTEENSQSLRTPLQPGNNKQS